MTISKRGCYPEHEKHLVPDGLFADATWCGRNTLARHSGRLRCRGFRSGGRQSDPQRPRGANYRHSDFARRGRAEESR